MPNINVEFNEPTFEELKKCKPEGYTWARYILASRWIMGRLASEPKTEWGEEWGQKEPFKFSKPCHHSGYCSYGQIVEMFPLQGKERDEKSCKVFGHDCPVFYLAEPMSEKIPEE